ncbi:MAG: lysylphosphatidylglycerol synthase transmembrane domain-containing protein [Bacilli bacterium]|nr:lysylphosphatidylglycerol synthase transmembrane domain-containing protein [Bacilli bacterium]
MKNTKRNGIILLLVTFLVMYFLLKDSFGDVVKLLSSANILFIFFAVGSLIMSILFETLCFKSIINEYKDDFSFNKILKLVIATKFFNGITPFSTGGQPMQVYMLKKDGLRMSKSTNIIIQNFILYQAALVIYGIIAFLINLKFKLIVNAIILQKLIVLGFVVNTLVMVVLIMVSFGGKFNKIMINKFIKILHKLHLIKDENKHLNQWEKRCEDFYEGSSVLLSKPKVLVQGVIFQFISLTFLYAIPFLIILAFDIHTNISIVTTIVAVAYILILGSFVPIPGASGGIEYGFLEIFAGFLGHGMLQTVLIIWRFITYYFPMIVGGIIFNFYKEKK